MLCTHIVLVHDILNTSTSLKNEVTYIISEIKQSVNSLAYYGVDRVSSLALNYRSCLGHRHRLYGSAVLPLGTTTFIVNKM